MINWNNISAHGFGAADDNWGGNGSVARVDMLDRNLQRLKSEGKWSLASVASAMNAAATQDVRAIDTVPLLQRLLAGPAPVTRRWRRCSPCWSPGATMAAAGWTGTSTARSTIPGRRSWTRHGRRSRMRS